jgi:ArsR family transcriptional regulator
MKLLSSCETTALALADVTRLRLIRLFSTAPIELCLCDLSAGLELPAYKLSRHLKVLREAGVLSARKEGRWLFHKLSTAQHHLKHLAAMVSALPDEGRVFSADRKRLEKTLKARDYEKCQTGCPPLKVKAPAETEKTCAQC